MTSWPGFEEEEKTRLLLSQATLTGILITVLSGILTALSSICLNRLVARLINVGVRRDARLISPDTHVIDMTGQNRGLCKI